MKYTDNFTWPVHVQNFISHIFFCRFRCYCNACVFCLLSG